MEKLLFESSGQPDELKKINNNRKRLGKYCVLIGLLAGISLGLIYYTLTNGWYADSFFEWLDGLGYWRDDDLDFLLWFIGLAAVEFVAGIVILGTVPLFDEEVRRLAMFTNHIEIYDSIQEEHINLVWNEIYSVKKENSYLLTFETAKGDFKTEVNNLNIARNIAEQKLYEIKNAQCTSNIDESVNG